MLEIEEPMNIVPSNAVLIKHAKVMKLPNEILVKIFRECDWMTKTQMSQTCKRFMNIYLHNKIVHEKEMKNVSVKSKSGDKITFGDCTIFLSSAQHLGHVTRIPKNINFTMYIYDFERFMRLMRYRNIAPHCRKLKLFLYGQPLEILIDCVLRALEREYVIHRLELQNCLINREFMAICKDIAAKKLALFCCSVELDEHYCKIFMNSLKAERLIFEADVEFSCPSVKKYLTDKAKELAKDDEVATRSIKRFIGDPVTFEGDDDEEVDANDDAFRLRLPDLIRINHLRPLFNDNIPRADNPLPRDFFR